VNKQCETIVNGVQFSPALCGFLNVARSIIHNSPISQVIYPLNRSWWCCVMTCCIQNGIFWKELPSSRRDSYRAGV